MGRKSITSGVRPRGKDRIEFDFEFEGKRYRPTVKRPPTEGNLRRALVQLQGIRERIASGTFSFSDEFPDFRYLGDVDITARARTCNEVFDEFLKHCESRMAKNDLAFVTMDGYRKILKQVWRPTVGDEVFEKIRYSRLAKVADSYKWSKKSYNNAVSALRCAFDYGYRDFPEKHNPASALKCLRITKKDRPVIDPFTIQEAETLIAAIHRDWGEAQGNYDEFRFFTGLRPSEQIAVRVTDCDIAQGKIKIDKARVVARDKDRTKTSEDRIVELCPRALHVLKRHLALRARLKLEGKINHDDLFFKDDGTPIRNLQYPWVRWRRTLTVTLKGRYREPYNARHSSVTWNLMLGKNPLWVAKQHGHSVQTMLETYAAWLEGTTESDLAAITRAMEGPSAAGARAHKVAVSRAAQSTELSLPLSPQELSLGCLQTQSLKPKCLITGGKDWRRERDSNPRRAFDPYTLSRGAPSTTRPSLRSRL
jgi:integrase